MGYLVLLVFGIITFIVVFIYQYLLTAKLTPLKRIVRLVLFTTLLIVCAYLRLQMIPNDSLESKVLKPIASPINKSLEALNQPRFSKELEQIVQEELTGEKGTYAIAIKNLKTNEYYTLNADKPLATASLYKLWVLATTYKQIESGKITKEKQIAFSAEDINRRLDIASEAAELTEGTVSNTVEGAMRRMITISDNYATHILTLTIGLSNVKALLAEYDLMDSSLGSPPTSTANNFLNYFETLYNKKLISEEASNEMIELLKDQQLNDRIPELLPEGTEVAHKTGELYGVKHDAGIVFSKKGDYIIILMSDTPSEPNAAKVEAQISKKVWDYFNK